MSSPNGDSLTARKFSLDFKFRYFTNGNVANFKFGLLLLDFSKYLNDSLYVIEIQKSNLYTININKLGQIAELNSVNIFIQ